VALFASGSQARKHKTPRTVGALLLREMATSYGRSPGGYLWALAEPIAAISLLAMVFSVAFRSPALGTSFPFFYASGYLPFMLYSDLGQKIATAIRFSRQLLKYPAVTYLDSILARFILVVLTQLMVFSIVCTGIVILEDLKPVIDPFRILNSLCMAATIGLGVGTLNCYFLSTFPLWERVWGILNKPLFIISGVLFLFDDVPEFASDFLWYNPLVHVIGEMRRGFFANYAGDYVNPIYVYSVSAVCFTLGLLLLNRFNRDILNDS
jgi:capsular polysaccharide transport system permease protein